MLGRSARPARQRPDLPSRWACRRPGSVPPESWLPRIAPTEYDTAGASGSCAGEVHDEKAAWMGGVAGSRRAVRRRGGSADVRGVAAEAARSGRRTAELDCPTSDHRPPSVAEFTRRQNLVPGSSPRARLGHPFPEQQRGHPAQRGSFGHTGFTGTSIWIDPEPRAGHRAAQQPGPPDPEQPAIGPLRIAGGGSRWWSWPRDATLTLRGTPPSLLQARSRPAVPISGTGSRRGCNEHC